MKGLGSRDRLLQNGHGVNGAARGMQERCGDHAWCLGVGAGLIGSLFKLRKRDHYVVQSQLTECCL